MSDGGRGVVNNAPLQRADEATAKTFGMSATTMHRELYIDDHRDEIDPTEYTDWNEGRISTSYTVRLYGGAEFCGTGRNARG